MILRSGLTSAGAGMLIGFAGALAVNTLLAGLLFDVRPEDPLAFASVAAVLGFVALVACYHPRETSRQRRSARHTSLAVVARTGSRWRPQV